MQGLSRQVASTTGALAPGSHGLDRGSGSIDLLPRSSVVEVHCCFSFERAETDATKIIQDASKSVLNDYCRIESR